MEHTNAGLLNLDGTNRKESRTVYQPGCMITLSFQVRDLAETSSLFNLFPDLKILKYTLEISRETLTDAVWLGQLKAQTL
jgi:hypothetical protein